MVKEDLETDQIGHNRRDEHSEPEQMRKLFIGGLDYRTTDESLKAYFEKYGEIVDVVVMKDPKTKRSRGFGFVAFSKAYMVDDAQKNRPHKIDGRAVDTKRAVPREEIGRPESGVTVKKLFVGGIKDDVDDDELREVFSEFGVVTSVSIPTEKESQKKRGFAFVEFDDYDAVDKACLQRGLMIKNKRVDVKKALSKNEIQMQQRGGGRMGGSMGGVGRGSSSGPWAGGRGDNWGNNQDNRSGWGNQGNYAGSGGPGGPGAYGNQGGYGNQGPWQNGGPGNQGGWNNPGNQGWGGQPGNYGGPGNWNQGPNDFGNNYGQSYGGGPMRSQGYGQASRATPYNTGDSSTGGPGGYGGGGNPGYGGGSMGGPGPNRRY